MDKTDRQTYLDNWNFLKNSMQADNVQLLPVVDKEGNKRVAICHVEGETFVPMAIMIWDNPFDLFQPDVGLLEEKDQPKIIVP
jgi:hypothetical protein